MFGLFKGKASQALKRSKDLWFNKVVRLFDSSALGDELWEELEELLVAADVGVSTATKLVKRVKERVAKERVTDVQKVRDILKKEMINLLKIEGKDSSDSLAKKADTVTPPYVIMVVGVNGSGKTTSIAKLGYGLKNEGGKIMIAAADTFRAAAIEQIRWWGDKIGAEVISHQTGADPGAVVFDALQAARNRGVKVVIIDTAGRLHTKFNLMEELKKIRRVIQKVDNTSPHETLLVIDATTGQNGLTQASYFTEAVGINGIILSKLDSTAKGGIVLAICDQLKIPVRFIGTGEQLEDFAVFDPVTFVDALMS